MATTLDNIINTWYPDKRDLVKWVYDLAKYLQDNPIPSDDTLGDIVTAYLEAHPVEAPVQSVNGKTGAVVLTAEDVGALPTDGGVLDGDLSIVAGGAQILLTATNDGQAIIVMNAEAAEDARTGIIANEDGHLQLTVGNNVYTVYDSGNYTPSGGGAVDSVNGKTGAVVLTASDVGALADSYTAPVQSVNGKTGAVVLTASDVGAIGTATILDLVYPVGAIYMSANDTAPSLLFGGTWARLEDCFLLAASDAAHPAGETGGEETHQLTLTEMPTHLHTFEADWQMRHASSTGVIATNGNNFTYTQNGGSETWSNGIAFSSASKKIDLYQISGNTSSTGGNVEDGAADAHNNMPPYLAVYMWRRTA